MKINIAIELDTDKEQDMIEIEQLMEIIRQIKNVDNQQDREYND